MTEAPATPAPAAERVAAVVEAARSGNLPLARRLAIEALADRIDHPLLLNLRALDHEEAGRLEEALADLRRAHLLAPKDGSILNACGLCLMRLERHEEAGRCFEQVVGLAPAFPPGWFNLGGAYERLGRIAEAVRAYEKSVDLEPRNAQGWASLAFLAARRRDKDSVQAFAERAFALAPGHPTAELALADIAVADPAEAEARLRALLRRPLVPIDEALAHGYLADALDAQHRFDEAFEAYAASNRVFAREYRARFEAPGQLTLAQLRKAIIAWAQGLATSPPPAAAPAAAGEARVHVFLLGFPRSGTTLAETALANHPDIVSLEERNTLDAAVREFLTDAKGLERLEAASETRLESLRRDYWRRVAAFGVQAEGRIFIDKNPFNTLKLPLIVRLFPTARILFAVRDPRDVVLSCFRRRFNLNGSTWELLDLRGAARAYVETMRLAEIMRRRRPMAEHRLVYEDLVADFEGVLRAVLAFVGADWREGLTDIASRGARGEVASASASQIARGLFAEGVGQWRRYETQLAPVLDDLAPWVRHFGYPAGLP